MSDLFHHFTRPVGAGELPERFTWPFCYVPHPLCIEAADAVLAMAEAGEDVAKLIPNVVTEKDFDAICALYESGKCNYAAVNEAIIDKPAAEQVAMIEARMKKAGSKAELYYPVLAATGSKEVIPMLVEGYKASKKNGPAFAGMMMVADDAMIPYLYQIATENADLREYALERYIQLTQASKALNAQVKYMNYRKALEMDPKTQYKNMALRALSATQTYQGMMLAAEYLDNAETAQAAANTILEIATKHPEFYSAEVKALLEKVAATLNDPDAVYKRKDIEKFISENTARESHSIVSKLTPEEEAEGFLLRPLEVQEGTVRIQKQVFVAHGCKIQAMALTEQGGMQC